MSKVAPSILCGVCQTLEKKYSCPKCPEHYCSVACCKLHKETCPETEKEPKSKRPKKSSTIFLNDEDDTIVPQETLEKLGQSEEIKRVLHNPHLRDFLSHLNSTHNPKGFMAHAMQEPLFVEFADACMKVLHPETCQEEELSLEQVESLVKEAIEDS